MSNLATAFKQEIARVARRELRAEIDALKAAAARQRAAAAEVRREQVAMHRELAVLRKQVKVLTSNAAEQGGGKLLRFSPERLVAARKKLGLSARQLGLLIGVNEASIYAWESGKGRPGQEQLQSISAVRKLGLRALRARLAELESE